MSTDLHGEVDRQWDIKTDVSVPIDTFRKMCLDFMSRHTEFDGESKPLDPPYNKFFSTFKGKGIVFEMYRGNIRIKRVEKKQE